MKKQLKIPVSLVLLLVVVLIGVLGIFVFNIQIPTMAGLGEGVTTLSCNNPNYITSDQNYANGSLMCSMALTGSAKQVGFIFDESTLKSLFNITASKSATFSGSLDGSLCSYKLDAIRNYTIWEYKTAQMTESDFGDLQGCRKCPKTTGTSFTGYTFLFQTSYEYYMRYGDRKIQPYACQCVYRKPAGIIYYLDPSIFNDFSANLTMSMDSKEYTAIISQTNPTARTDLFTAEYIGGLQGQQSCPAQPSVTAYFTGTGIQYHNILTADSLLGYQNQHEAYKSQPKTFFENIAIYNNLKTQYLNSVASTGQYCQIVTKPQQTVQTTSISCNPQGTTNIPLFNLYVNAGEFAIIVPSGQPKIISVEFDQTVAATETKGIMKVQNLGETDAFDGSITGDKQICTFSNRVTINAGETKDIPISCQGAGLIGQYTAEVHSVNSPDKSDSTTVRISLLPFCSKQSPSSNKILVNTAYGCEFICPNYGEYDVFDVNCAKLDEIEEYDRCMEYADNVCVAKLANGTCIQTKDNQCIEKKYYDKQYHCLGEGKYTTMNKYMDMVYEGDISPFIPNPSEHQYFIVSSQGKMVCRTVDEYGYSNGQVVDTLDFDYNLQLPQAEETIEDDAPPSDIDIIVPEPEIPPEEQEEYDETYGTGGLQLDQYYWIIGIVVIVGVGVYIISKRKK